VSKTAPENIHVDDIIVYQLGEAKILHRVVEVTGDETSGYSFITKGDANSAADPDPVAPDQVGGKVIMTIPKAGWLLIFLSGAG